MDYVQTMRRLSRVWERKILSRVYSPKRDTNGWRIRTNKELQDQYRSADIVTSIKVRRLEWDGHVVRMDNEWMVKKCFWETQKTKAKVAGLWEDDLKTLGVRRWRKSAEDCEEWAIILKEAMVKL
jgi:hypothetical protein